MRCPKAREDGLVVERVDGELLVYDLERDRAHRLNESAALVFDHCDGERTVDELAALLGEDVVERGLVRLGDSHLLDEPADGDGWSRRQALRRIGVAGAAAGLGLPVVKSIVAPTFPAQCCQDPPSSCGEDLDGNCVCLQIQ